MTFPRKNFALLSLILFFTLGSFAFWVSTTDAGDTPSSGADVTVIYLPSLANYTNSGPVNGYRAYALGTTSCNVGDKPLWWCDDFGDDFCEVNQHPVIAQNVYRLKDGSFRQIGMSWLKHGFLSLNTPDPACGDCVEPPHGGDQLGTGCTDAYGAGLNGSRPLGLRSEVNPLTGDFPFPNTTVGSSASFDQRIKILDSDLDPDLNAGAQYWAEGHYIAADDSRARNDFNNASYREVVVGSGNSRNLLTTGPTVRELPAIYAWKAADPEVEIVTHDTAASAGRERFHIARRITRNGSLWHYEYAVHNLNSNQAARRLTIDFPHAVEFSNVGFYDVDHHSGEPYATTDWDIAVDGANGTVVWSTDTFATDENANALRWGTMFTFWFDANVPANGMTHELEGFRDGIAEMLPFSDELLVDGFESGDVSAWSLASP